jgi:transposase-like protein
MTKEKKPTCPHCNKNDAIIKRGRYASKNKGIVQNYYCKRCKSRFKPKNKYNTHHKDDHVSLALDLHSKGYTTRKIAQILKDKGYCDVTYVTIHRWVKNFKPSLEKLFSADEIRTAEGVIPIERYRMMHDTRLTAWFFFDHRDPMSKHVMDQVLSTLELSNTIQVKYIEISDNAGMPEVNWFDVYSDSIGDRILPTIRLIDTIPSENGGFRIQPLTVFHILKDKKLSVNETMQQMRKQIIEAIQNYARTPFEQLSEYIENIKEANHELIEKANNYRLLTDEMAGIADIATRRSNRLAQRNTYLLQENIELREMLKPKKLSVWTGHGLA